MIWNFPRFFRVFSPAGGIFRNSEPVWCPHCFLCLLFPGKGKRTAFSFCFSKKKTPGKRKETGENFRMVSPDPFYRPEPCSGLAAYGSRRIYDRLCRGRCRAQLFATKERYRCGLPLAGTHRPCGRAMPAPTDSIAVPVVNIGATIGRPLKAPLSGEPSRGSRVFDWEGRLTRGGLETIIKFPTWTRHSVILRSRGTNGWNRNTYHL